MKEHNPVNPTPCEHHFPYTGKPALALTLAETMDLGIPTPPCPTDPEPCLEAMGEPCHLPGISEEAARQADLEFDLFLNSRATRPDDPDEA